MLTSPIRQTFYSEASPTVYLPSDELEVKVNNDPNALMNEEEDLSTFFLARPDERAHDLFRQVLQLGISFKSSNKVWENSNPAPGLVSFDRMPDTGISHNELLEQFSALASRSSNVGSPNFLGFPDSGNSIAGLAASFLVPLLNQNMVNHETCSPEATFVEMEVVHWLRENLGYSVPSSYSKSREIGGILTLGGCLSNTIALLAAREKLFPGCGLNGLPVLPGTVRILVPDIIEHYSIRSGMSWLGMGEKNVVRVPVDDRYCIDQGALEQVIAHEREMGHNILACVAYAGDSRSMRIDKLDSLAEILGKHNIWFHVDACHGSQLAFSERHKHALRGIERADSITIDPHKVLCIPYTCSFVLFKDPTTLANTATSSDLILNTQWSLGQITPFIGSKAFDALKLWATIKVLGKQRIGKLVDERLDLTLAIQTAIRQRRNLILLNETDINSCMFIFIPYQLRRHCLQKSVKISDADLEKLNMVNRQIKEAIRLEGSSYVHGFTLKSCSHELIQPNRILYTMRTMNGNPLSTLQHVHALLDKIEQLGEQYLSKANYKFVDHDDPSNPFRRVHQKLDSQLHILFAGQEYVAVIYGSSAYDDMKLMSDIDLMVFAPESLSSSKATCTALETLFCSIMAEEGIIVDAEVPFNRKLLVSIPFATNAATGASIHVNGDGRICSVQKTPEYLASDEMIQRLVFNVLTTPVKIISGSTEVSKTFLSLSRVASYNLVELLGRINPGQFEISSCNPQDMANFIKLAIMDGCRSGEDYLGYKDRSAVKLKLNKVFLDFCKNKEK